MEQRKETKPIWGQKEWFEKQLVLNPLSSGSYFAHDKNGYQLVRHDKIVNLFSRYCFLAGRRKVLDVGCGLGDLSIKILNCMDDGSQLVGYDFAEALVELARERYPRQKFLVGSLGHIDEKKESFDVIICSEVLYYLNDADRQLALDNLYEMLRPNGFLIFTSRLDDGSKYLEKTSAVDAISSRLSISVIDFSYYRIFNVIDRSAKKFSRALAILKHGQEIRVEFVKKHLPNIPSSVSSALCYSTGFLAWIGSRPAFWLLEKILSSTALPKLSGSFGKLLGTRATNVTVIAQKVAD